MGVNIEEIEGIKNELEKYHELLRKNTQVNSQRRRSKRKRKNKKKNH